jgi:hypothetical protein
VAGGRLAWPVLAVALLAPACLGGGESSSGSSSQRLTVAEYRTQASAICATYRHRIAALGTPSDLRALAVAGSKAIDLQAAEVRQLRALRPPQSEAGKVDSMLDAVDGAIRIGRNLVSAARKGDTAAVMDAVPRLQAQLEAANRLARDLKLGQCAIVR